MTHDDDRPNPTAGPSAGEETTMTGSDQPRGRDIAPGARLKMLRCRRTNKDYSFEDHLRCPYCFGNEKDLETRDHGEFCDYDPSRDPVHFGFPEDSDRHTRG